MIKNKFGMSISSPFVFPLTQFSYFSDVAQLAYFFQMFGTTVPTIIVIKSTGKKINWMQEQLLYDRSLPSLHRLSQLRWKPKRHICPTCVQKNVLFGGFSPLQGCSSVSLSKFVTPAARNASVVFLTDLISQFTHIGCYTFMYLISRFILRYFVHSNNDCVQIERAAVPAQKCQPSR